MKGIQLKLKGEWIALPEDFSLKLEQTNPLFNEQGTFSFPFEVPIEANRNLFKNIADPFGDIRLNDIDGMEAELWFNGVMLYKGLVETDEEVEFEESIPMTFISGISDFMKKIEKLNAQDVPLDREIKLGYVVTHAIKPTSDSGVVTDPNVYLPEEVMMNYTEYNITNAYPQSVFCNVRVCASNEMGNYKTLEAKRPFSGVCYYVMYLLDLIFDMFQININRNDLLKMEDMSRLAFFSTRCHTYLSELEETISLSQITTDDFAGKNFSLIYSKIAFGTRKEYYETNSFTYKKKDVFATNKNFPNVLVKDLIEDLNNVFGIRLIQDVQSNSINIVYLKDIFNEKEVLNLNNEVFSYTINKKKKTNIILSYGVSDNTAFNYSEYQFVKEYNGYMEILDAGISIYSRDCAIDKLTGNAYRVKVNKETGGNPSLFEVAGFRDFNLDDLKEEGTESISINFAPVIVNDITGGDLYNLEKNSGENLSDPEIVYRDQTFAVFIDVELLSSSEFNKNISKFNNIKIGPFTSVNIYLRANSPEQYDTGSNDESPLRSYDSGYTLGIMRGPGSDSKLEYTENYDQEGNSSWVQTAANYAFTSDSCDNYGRFFDYNGTEAGGADQTGRFSLKLIAEKDGFPVDNQYANRGLVSKFLSEYLYFLENRKTVILEVEMNITQLIAIDFLKRYKIGDFVGFINKVSYNMTVNGMEDVTIEMYTL